MRAITPWAVEPAGPSDLEQLGSAVFFGTERFEEFVQTQTFLTLNSVFRHVVTSLVF